MPLPVCPVADFGGSPVRRTRCARRRNRLTAYVADCKFSTSTFVYIPGAMRPLPEGALPLIAGWAHEERCGRCDVEPVLARGDQSIRTEVGRLELLLRVRERTN